MLSFTEPPLVVMLPSRMANLTVDFGGGSKRAFRGEVPPQTSALDALSYATSAGNIAVEYASGTHGAIVRRIGQMYASARGKQWRLYLNGRYVQGDPMTSSVNPADVIEWKYE